VSWHDHDNDGSASVRINAHALAGIGDGVHADAEVEAFMLTFLFGHLDFMLVLLGNCWVALIVGGVRMDNDKRIDAQALTIGGDQG
jgi:hypothetical protein